MTEQRTTPHAPAAPPSPPLFDRAFIDDPYPAYAWLREHSPVHRTRLPNGVEAYLVTRYEDVKAVLADPRLSKNAATSFPGWTPGRTGIPGEHRSGIAAHLLNLDPPDHTRLRRLVAKAFTPRRIAEFEPQIRRIADRLLDACEAAAAESGAPVDLIRGYACPLPVAVILEMLGVPEEDQAIFHEWAFGVVDRGGGRGGVARSVRRIRGYLREIIHKKRLNPGDDLLTALVRASDHGEQLSEDEAAAMAFILLFAGFETTVNLIGNGAFALLTHPRQREGVGPDQIHRAGQVEGVEQPVRDPADLRGEVGDPARGEGLGDQAAQPGVVRRVDVQQVRGDPGSVFAGDAGAPGTPARIGGRGVLRQPRVGEHRLRVLVPGHQVRLDAVGQRGPVHRRVLPQPAVGRVGVVDEGPAEERRGRLGHADTGWDTAVVGSGGGAAATAGWCCSG